MLCRWNHSVQSLLNCGVWGFFHIVTWTPSKFLCVSVVFISLGCNSPWYGCSTFCLTVNLLEDIWAVSSLGLVLNKREYEYFCTCFRWTSFHVSEITAEIFNCWFAWKLYVELKKYCNSIPTTDAWVSHSLTRFDAVTIFHVGLSHRPAVMASCGFNLHLPDG